MAKFRYQHIKSSVEGKAPTAAQIKTAEIGVNDFAGDEKLFIKNSAGEVVDFPRGYSQTVIDENERVTAEALNYLNTNKLDASAYTPTDLSNYYTKDETSGKTEIQNALDEKADTATTLGGYGITDAYTKDETSGASEIQDALDDKADTATTYTKTEVDARDLWVSGTGTSSVALKGGNNTASGNYSIAEGYSTSATNLASHAEGYNTLASGSSSHAEGYNTQALGMYSHAEGDYTVANNYAEHATGHYNVSSKASNTFGNSGNTLFSVGNGTYSEGHNAFEIRQNGDIYITSGNTDVKLQDSIPSVDGYADSVKYNSTTHYVEFYHGTTAGTKVFEYDASPFLIDGMVEDVKIEDVEISGETVTCLVISFNTAAGKQDINIPLSDIFDPSNYYTKADIDDMEYVISTSLNDLNARKLDASAYTPTDLSNYYTKSETSGATEIQNALDGKSDTGHTHDDRYYTEIEIDNLLAGKVSISDIDQVIDSTTSASTGAVSTSAVYGFVTSYTPSITVDQDFSNTASTNPISTKAVYSAVTDNEFVWANTFAALSGITSAHTADTSIHVTAADKEKLHTHSNKTELDSITGTVGTMAYEDKTSYSSATEVNTALGNKANTSDLASYADSVKYNSTSHYVEFYHGTTAGTKVFEYDASPFIIDGMVDDVRIENGNLVIDFNTASGKQDISIPLTDIFDPSNYYNKTAIDNLVGSGFTSSSITEVIIENEEIVSAALTDLDERKLDASAYTPSVELWVSGTGENAIVQKGGNNIASGKLSVAMGSGTTASGDYSHAEGRGCVASGINSHAEGVNNVASSIAAHAEGMSTSATSYEAHSEGGLTLASGSYSHAEGISSVAKGDYSHAEGNNTKASGDSSHAEGAYTSALTSYSHAEGYMALASGNNSHAEGNNTKASGNSSHAEGAYTSALTSYSHAEGGYTTASGSYSHAEGISSVAKGDYSHAEGNNTVASNSYAHAEGNETTASGYASHSEGSYSKALATNSHAEGNSTSAFTSFSHTEGLATIATNNSEHASGQFNVSHSASTTFGNSGNTLFSVGNGTADNARHNAFEIRQNGDIYITSGNSDIKLQDYIGSVETVTAITPSNSGSTEPIATKVVAENELVMANALNDLNSRKLDASAYTTTSAVTSGSTDAITSGGVYAQMDGIKLKKITQSAYDALVQAGTVDNNTLYIITD